MLFSSLILLYTDSGGVTEEATIYNIPCITIRKSTERPETVSLGSNMLIGNNYSKIKGLIDKISKGKWKKSKIPEKWDGKAAYRILNIIEKLL